MMDASGHPHEALSAYLDGELPVEERERVDAHLRSCGDCSRLLADLRRLAEAAQDEETPPVPADLGDRVMARLGRPATRRRPWLRRVPMAAAATLAAMTLLWIAWRQDAALRSPDSLPSIRPSREASPDAAQPMDGSRARPTGTDTGTANNVAPIPEPEQGSTDTAAPSKDGRDSLSSTAFLQRLDREDDKLDATRRQAPATGPPADRPARLAGEDAAGEEAQVPSSEASVNVEARSVRDAPGEAGLATAKTSKTGAGDPGTADRTGDVEKKDSSATATRAQVAAALTDRAGRTRVAANEYAPAPEAAAAPAPAAGPEPGAPASGTLASPEKAATGSDAETLTEYEGSSLLRMGKGSALLAGSLFLQGAGPSILLAPDGSLVVHAEGYACELPATGDDETRRQVAGLLEAARRLQEEEDLYGAEPPGEEQRSRDGQLVRIGTDGVALPFDDVREAEGTVPLAVRLRMLVRDRYGAALDEACGPPPRSLLAGD